VTAPAADQSVSLATLSIRQRLERQVVQMERARLPHLEGWRDIEAFVAPFSSNVDQHQYRVGDGANVIHEAVYFARITLASFLSWGMTNQSRAWRQWAITDADLRESESVKVFTRELNDRAMTILSGSNFYEIMTWTYGEWPAFGTSVVLIEEDEQDVFRYVPLPIGSYTLADDAKGDPIALARTMWTTVRQLVERFATNPDGTVNMGVLSTATQALVRGGHLEVQVKVSHLITPNDTHVPSGTLPEDSLFASYYWETDSPVVPGKRGYLAKEGYREWPAMVFRWKRNAFSPWGVDAPGQLTLGANKSLQSMEADLLMAIEKQVLPPMLVPTDLLPLSLLPAARNAVNTRTGQVAGPLHVVLPAAIERIAAEIDRVVERIQQLWNTRLIIALTGGFGPTREKTAREVEEISQEKFLILGPLLEAASPAFKAGSDREFAIMQRRGLLPDIPPEMEGRTLVVEYTSALAVAQKSVGFRDLQEFGRYAAEFAQATGHPGVLRKLDVEQFMDELALRGGVPPRVVRTDDAVAAIAEAEAEAARQQTAVEQGALEAKAARDLSQAPTGGDTALSALIQGGARGPLAGAAQ